MSSSSDNVKVIIRAFWLWLVIRSAFGLAFYYCFRYHLELSSILYHAYLCMNVMMQSFNTFITSEYMT